MKTKIYDSRTKEPIVGTLPNDGLTTLRGDVMIVTEEGKVFHISPPDAEAAGCDCFMKAEKFRLTVSSSHIAENTSEFAAKNMRSAKRRVSEVIPMSGRWYEVAERDISKRDISWGYRGEHGWRAAIERIA